MSNHHYISNGAALRASLGKAEDEQFIHLLLFAASLFLAVSCKLARPQIIEDLPVSSGLLIESLLSEMLVCDQFFALVDRLLALVDGGSHGVHKVEFTGAHPSKKSAFDGLARFALVPDEVLLLLFKIVQLIGQRDQSKQFPPLMGAAQFENGFELESECHQNLSWQRHQRCLSAVERRCFFRRLLKKGVDRRHRGDGLVEYRV